MNHARIDHLLQVTATRPEPLTGSSHTRDAGPPFDNVFRQASEAETPPRRSDPQSSSTSFSTRPAESTSSSPEESVSDSNDADSPLEQAASDDALSADEPLAAVAAESSDNGQEEESADDSASTDEEVTAAVAVLAAEQVTKLTTADSPTLAVPTGNGEVEAVDPATEQSHDDARTKTQGKQLEDAKPLSAATAVVEVQSTDEPADGSVEQDQQVTGKRSVPSKSDQPNVEAAALTTAADSTSEQTTSEQPAKTEGQQQRHAEHAKSTAQQADAAKANKESAAKSVASTTTTGAAKASPAIERTEPAIKSEKKSASRVDAPTRDAAAAPVERPTTIVRTAESTASAPVVANVAPQLAAEATGAAASAATAKTAGGAAESKPGILSLSRVDRSGANGTRGAQRAGQTESTPHVDPARFVSRVARAVQTAQERGGPLQLRLSPPELGAMRIELLMNQGTLTATIETDNSNARQVLLDNLPALRDRLADQNIKIERFDVDVRRDSSGNQQNYAPQDRDQSRQQNTAARNLGHERRQSAMPTLDEPQPVHRTISSTSINVVA